MSQSSFRLSKSPRVCREGWHLQDYMYVSLAKNSLLHEGSQLGYRVVSTEVGRKERLRRVLQLDRWVHGGGQRSCCGKGTTFVQNSVMHIHYAYRYILQQFHYSAVARSVAFCGMPMAACIDTRRFDCGLAAGTPWNLFTNVL